jgi:hypothetical protein
VLLWQFLTWPLIGHSLKEEAVVPSFSDEVNMRGMMLCREEKVIFRRK